MSLSHTMDPALFARDLLAFHPYANQARVLDPSVRRGPLNRPTAVPPDAFRYLINPHIPGLP